MVQKYRIVASAPTSLNTCLAFVDKLKASLHSSLFLAAVDGYCGMMFDSEVLPATFAAYQSTLGVGVSTYHHGFPVDALTNALDRTLQAEELGGFSAVLELSPADVSLKFGLTGSQLYLNATGGDDKTMSRIGIECGLGCEVDATGAYLWHELADKSEHVEVVLRKDINDEPVGLKSIRDVSCNSSHELMEKAKTWARRLDLEITGCETTINSKLHAVASLPAACNALGPDLVWKIGVGSPQLSPEAQRLLEGKLDSTSLVLVPLFSCEVAPGEPYSGIVGTLKATKGKWQVLVASYFLEKGKLDEWLAEVNSTLFPANSRI